MHPNLGLRDTNGFGRVGVSTGLCAKQVRSGRCSNRSVHDTPTPTGLSTTPMPQNHTHIHTDDSRPANTEAHTHTQTPDKQHIRTYLRRRTHTHMHIPIDSTLRAHMHTRCTRLQWVGVLLSVACFFAAIVAGKVAQRTPHCERRPSGPASAGVRQAHPQQDPERR